MSKIDAHDAHLHAQALRDMSAQVLKGITGAQIRRMVLPSQLIRVREAIGTGDAPAVSFIMRDVIGEGISLAAGSSLHGGAAMDALSLAQAQCFLDLRDRRKDLRDDDMHALASLMVEHRESLIEWVRTGKAGSDVGRPAVQQESDLTMIGAQFLTQPALRKAAISIFVASTAVIEAGLTLFTSEK